MQQYRMVCGKVDQHPLFHFTNITNALVVSENDDDVDPTRSLLS